MERKIGEIFELGGEWYQCVESDSCGECSLFTTECGSGTKSDLADKVVGQCSKVRRIDNKHVIFKKLEKVGEPFTSVGKLYQHYKVFDIDNVYGDVFWCVHNYKAKTLTIEIKQNKEDMEEKGQCGDNRFEIIAKAKEALLKETNIARDEQEMAVIDNILFRCWQMGWLDKYDDTKHSDSESIGKSLKPFSLEAAKAGKPVCTRDGRKARIICFDKKGDYPIVALVNDYNKEEYIKNYDKFGKKFIDGETTDDLMMLPEKKEGWVNVYKRENEYVCENECNVSTGIAVYKSEGEAKRNIDKNEIYVNTIKITWEE